MQRQTGSRKVACDGCVMGYNPRMEIKRLAAKYVYRIEPRPGGGFSAHASDPSAPALEASTREELQQKIQATVLAGLSADFPGLKLPTNASAMKFSIHVERTPNGTFDIHSADPNSAPIQAATQGEVESHFAEKIISFLGQHMMAGASEALREQLAAGNVKVFIKGGSEFTVTTAVSQAAAAQPQLASSASSEFPPNQASSTDPVVSSTYSNGSLDASPITRVSEGGGRLLRIVLAMLLLGAVIFFWLQHLR